IGNWVKMTTATALVANGKIGYEPTEATYRTIFYYLDASVAKMLAANNDASASDADNSHTKAASNNQIAATIPPATSLDKLNASRIQPVLANFISLPKTSDRMLVTVKDSEPP